jgi:hypothetical protein
MQVASFNKNEVSFSVFEFARMKIVFAFSVFPTTFSINEIAFSINEGSFSVLAIAIAGFNDFSPWSQAVVLFDSNTFQVLFHGVKADEEFFSNCLVGVSSAMQ